MEHVAEDAPLAPESRTDSEQVLIQPHGTSGGSNRGSNSRALKIAGITTLVCLLVSAQVFTAYLVFDQKQQIQGLQMNNQKMEKQMSQRLQVTQKMVRPLGSMPLLDFEDENPPPPTTPKALTKVEQSKAPSVHEQLQELMKDFDLPRFNKSFLENLQTLKQQYNETSWRSFQSWLRYWLIFQTAQKTSAPQQAPVARTKCQTEAATGLRGMIGSYKPQCDDQGNYRTMQCWHSTHQCWCVDESGTPIEGSNTRGRPNCDQFLSSRRTQSDALVMSAGLFDDVDK